ncbi:MAG: phosphatidylserine decarboxylase [Puniceicoccales bacterium]|jgi:phosphatidylserine decarboxylase|nr:phosphatidylserine decarboxylase [Puniceicoccales bacterium]
MHAAGNLSTHKNLCYFIPSGIEYHFRAQKICDTFGKNPAGTRLTIDFHPAAIILPGKMKKTLLFNRYTNAVENEEVFFGWWMNFAYSTGVGKLAIAPLIKRKIFSTLAGKFASSSLSRARIIPFIEKFKLRSDSFEKKVDDFESFNDFFYRKLKPFSRPISPKPNGVSASADGRHLAYRDMQNFSPFFIKGEQLSAENLTMDKKIADRFRGGSILISRLCPADYHRFHFPVACVPGKTFLVNGEYAAVHPIAMAGKMNAFLENKRMSTLLHTDICGDILMIEIGSTCVGTIKQTFAPDKPALKGQEKGYFKFGGSTVILIFEKGRVKFSADVLDNTSRGMETYVLMGDEIATIL